MIRRVWGTLILGMTLAFAPTKITIALNDTSTSATNCSIGAGRDANNNTFNCSFGAGQEQLKNMQNSVDNLTSEFAKFLNAHKPEDFEEEYPIGFALFYSDGRRTLNFDNTSNNGITFDPRSIKPLEITQNEIELSGFQLKSSTGSEIDVNKTYIEKGEPAKTLMKFMNAAVCVKYLGMSKHGLGWIIGIKPIENIRFRQC